MPKDKKKLEDELGENTDEKNPQEATPDGTEGEENPLEKMDEISKAKPQKKEKGSTDLDEDVITNMLKTGENTDGMFSPEDEEEHEDEDEKAKVKVGSKVEPSDKYKDNFKDDLLKHPDEYKVNTPRGEMTIAEAIRAGYNPITKNFEKDHSAEAIKERHLAGLNDADRAALEQFTAPQNAQVAPADAEMYGLQPGSPMIRPEQQANPAPGMNPMMQGGAPAAPAMPGQEQPAQGGVDLSALLGGGQ